MNFIRSLRARRVSSQVAALAEFYDETTDVAAYQLEQLNYIWLKYVRSLPAFRELLLEGKCPDRFDSLEQFADVVPTVSRRSLAGSLDAYCIKRPKADAVRITGGSTSEPIKLPAWKSEFNAVASSQWLGRYWQGVLPSDRLFLLWGHSHILGSGLRGKVNAFKRQLVDLALGYCRVSAYDLSIPALRRAGQQLIDFKPAYVYGYSVALDQFARANADRREDFRRLKLKCIQATAERFPSSESRDLLGDLFGCPVTMEYGAMETGHLAATAPNGGGYRVYWRDYLVEGIQQDSGEHKVLVTSLFPRATPLVRYELGDTVQLYDSLSSERHVLGVKDFVRVGGRCNYGIRLADGTFFHSEVFTHCIRDIEVVEAFQIVQEGERITVEYIARRDILKEEEGAAHDRFSKVDTRLRAVAFRRVDQLRKSPAGKTPMIISDRNKKL